jgi:hypothetical protein
MSIKFPNTFGTDVVVYTDGVCFNNNSSKSLSKLSYITEGIWYFPFEYRLAVYTANEIFDNTFLDITNRVTVPIGTFLVLEKEIEVPPLMSGMNTEIYYDISFHKEKSLVSLLQEDISLADKGNLNTWKSSIELIDFVFKH